MSWTEKPQTVYVCDSLRRNHLREFFHDTRSRTSPASFASVQLQTCISADASHNVIVVDRHVYGPWRFHATDPLDQTRPPLDTTFASDMRRDASTGLVLRAVPVPVSVAFISLESRVRLPNQAFCIVCVSTNRNRSIAHVHAPLNINSR